MSGILDRCTCTPNARVFVAAGQVYCTRCLAARSLLPLSKQDDKLGVLGLFYAPKEPLSWTCPRGWPTLECSPAGCCWLTAIFPIARMTSGNGNFQQRMERVAQAIYHEGALTPAVLNRLQVYDRGCDWYPIVGPVPGVALYANTLHVSDQPFPGATHVLTNLPLPQRPKRQPFCPFEKANANVWAFGPNVVYETEGKWSWAPRGDCQTQFDPVPYDLRLRAKFLIDNFPAHHIVTLSAYTHHPRGVSFRVENQDGHLDPDEIPDGTCWQALFYGLPEGDFEREVRLAVQFGYQTKHGVPGKYIQRRLQINGLRAVVDPKGPLQIQAFSTATSWIRHIHVDGVDPLSGPDFVDICRIRVEPNTAPLANRDEQIFRFGQHKWYGKGKRLRDKIRAQEEQPDERALSPRELAQVKKHETIGRNIATRLNRYSPPGDGNCGWHCLSAVCNRMLVGAFQSSLTAAARPSQDWATDEDLVQAAQRLGLPVGLYRNGACPDAKYVLSLKNDHWIVTCKPGMAPKRLPPECAHGVCQHIGSQIGGAAEPCIIRNDTAALLQHAIHLPSSAIPDALVHMMMPNHNKLKVLTPADVARRSDVAASAAAVPASLSGAPTTSVQPAVPGETCADSAPVDLTRRSDVATPVAAVPAGPPSVADDVLDLSRSDVGSVSSEVVEHWTVSQILSRTGLPDCDKFASVVDLAHALFTMTGATPEEINAAIDATIVKCASVEECCAAVQKCLKDVAITKQGFALGNYFPDYQPKNTCTAIVPVADKVKIKEFVPGSTLREAMAGIGTYVEKEVPVTVDRVRHGLCPGGEQADWAMGDICRKIRDEMRNTYGYGWDPVYRWYPDAPADLLDIIEKAETDFLAMCDAQASLAGMKWFADNFDVAAHVANYSWVPQIVTKQPKVVKAKQPDRRRTPTPVAPAPPAEPEVPDSWEDLATEDQPVDLSPAPAMVAGGNPQFAPLTFGAKEASWGSECESIDQPLDLSVKGSIKFGPPSSQNSVCLTDMESVVLEDPAPALLADVPLDLSCSSVTVFDAAASNSSPAQSPPESVFGDEEKQVIRPPKSAQALIDAGGDLAKHLIIIKKRAMDMCRQACDPNYVDHPSCVIWCESMWNRLDMLTWHNKSKYQASYQLATFEQFLPRMIQETPPPHPCPIMWEPASPPRSKTPSVDLTIRSGVTTPRSRASSLRQEEQKIDAAGVADVAPTSEDEEKLAPEPQLAQPATLAGKWRNIFRRDPAAQAEKKSEEVTPPPETTKPPDEGGTPPGNDTTWSRIGAKCGEFTDKLCGKVFEITSHLPAFFARAFHSGGGYTAGDWCFAAFVLCCLLLCYSYSAFGCAPLLGVFSGSPRRTRIGVFGVWMAFAALLFRPLQDPVGSACDSDSPECRRLLLAFEQLQPWKPVRGLVVGPFGLTASLLGKLLGGPRNFWAILLRLMFMADVIAAGAYIVGQGRCKKCWGRCIRTAPQEVAMNVFPFTRATRQSLVDICNRFCSPKLIDPIFVATGWRGCYIGQSPIEQPSSKPFTYQNLDEKKISATTIVTPPYDPTQAIKCLKVLQAGGAIAATKVPEVTKIDSVPFLAPFLPKLPVNPDVKIVVDTETFTCAIRSGYDTSALILGEGDFAKENGMKIQQLQRPSGGATYVMAAVHVAVWMVLHMLAGIYVMQVDQCGAGTRDPWCSNPYSVPVFGSGTLCSRDLCISPSGLTLPLSTIIKDFGAREAGVIGLVIASLAVLAHKMSMKSDAVFVLASLFCHVHPLLAWVVALFPLTLKWFSAHPFTIVWVIFFLVTCNPAAGILAGVFLVLLWILGRFTHVAGVVTPYDIHAYTNGPKGASALLTAPEGTYLAAVRRAALTGRTVMFCPSNVGSLLEGAFRTQKPCLNTVNVVGSSMGSGGVFTYKGRKVCVTATHVLSGNAARVTGPGYNRMLEFETFGDFAIAQCDDWQGTAPKADAVPKNWTGRAFWLTATGVEPGVIGKGYAFCFTACGDSGSPVLTESGDLIGVHTGSNKQGGGIVTRPDGTTCNIENVALSELSKHFAGPLVPLGDIKVGPHIIVDTHDVPSDLCALLASKPTLEGGLSTVQLLCVFFLLWRMMGYVYTPIIAVLFFCLNEILPAVLCRSVFSFGMTALAWLSPWSAQVLMIRLLTAALNRNKLSLLFYVIGAIAGFVSDLSVTGLNTDITAAMSTYCFLPRYLCLETPVPLAVAAAVHFVAVVLWLFKYRTLHNVLVGDGHFSAAFFLRYFAEGKLRQGVSQSCGMTNESLTGALACNLSEDDLAFLTRLTDFKCFVSASNMRNAAQQYIEAAYAKALRIELSQLVQVDKMRGVLAKLEAFADTATPSLNVGDVVVLIGSTPVGEVFETMVGSVKHAVQAIETRTLAGTKMTVCKVVDPKPVLPERKVALPVPATMLENDSGNRAGGRGDDEDDPDRYHNLLRQKRRAWTKVSEHDIDGVRVYKMWDKNTGDTVYCRAPAHDDRFNTTVIGKHGYVEGASPKTLPHPSKLKVVRTKWIAGEELATCRDIDTGDMWSIPVDELPSGVKWEICEGSPLEAARLNIEQALTNMGTGKDLTAQEVEKLKRIIEQLQGLTKEQALNLLTASGLTRCGRGGLTISKAAMKIVKYHSRTFSLGDVNLKVTTKLEAVRAKPHGHLVVAELQDDAVVLLRPSPPSLIDVLIAGQDTQPSLCANHGPGNSGVDGSLWDFETPPTKEELELSKQIIQACDARRGDAPQLPLPYVLHPVRGDPVRVNGVLKNTRFGDLEYKTPMDTKDPVHAAACYTLNTTPVLDGKSVVATTIPAGFELYVPTIPSSVLDYLDKRPDCPLMLTEHGSAAAAAKDLAKYDLSTQGFVLPGVLRLVRNYLHGHVGKCPPIHRPSNYPAKNSQAGINGNRFPTRDIQGIPNIDELCAQAVREQWQTVTPCTLKKQYCSKKKTRTILGTNNFIALAHRAALSGVTQGFMKKGLNSPIALGKNKFKELSQDVCGRCLEADLASCDRSTPAIIRWFTANLLYELACSPEALNSYVLNCCHDVVSTQSGAVTKRGGLSSGDPITSISNTVYSLVIYAQHMILSFLKSGHSFGLLYLQGQLKFEDMLQVQPLLVYSDDLVLHSESTVMPNYHWWVEHLDLMLGFKTDPKKTCVTDSPSFLGCRILNKRQLVPNRDRILAALGYHMKATNVSEYYASAAAILMDACACIEYDPDWFEDLVVGIAQCAKKDGYSFPGPSFFMSMWEKLRSNYEGKKGRVCGICGAVAPYASACGLDLCTYHTHFHQHCPVTIWCGHPAGSKTCDQCLNPTAPGRSDLDKVLREVPYKPPRTVVMKVESGLTLLDPGRYQTRRGLLAVRRGVRGNEVDLPDGEYQCTPLLPTCKDIDMVAVHRNVMTSKFVIGPPGSGKTHWLLSQVQDGDVIYTPTHQTMLDIIRALGTCRFNVPAGTTLQFPAPARHGPWVRILAGGWCPGKKSYLDEAAYCNHLDVLRILSKTSLTCLGDFRQLTPVGFEKHCFVFDMMPHTQLTTIWRFGQNICSAIQCEYEKELLSNARHTRVVFVSRPVAYGQVLTPYHRDREDGAITIDSSQGATYDVVTVHLPTPGSLNRPRALVAITRARHALFIYDPHKQMEKFFPLKEQGTPCNIVVTRDDALVVLDRNNKECTVAQALGNGDKFRATDMRAVDALRAVCADLEGSSSPLPKVARNLGFYFSPDLTQFAKLPEELAPHWPVVTCKNDPNWPDRLVASLRPIDKLSCACLGAGYMVGPSVFLGIPGTISYYLTMYIKGEPQPLPKTIFSTGRIEIDCREFLDDKEREVAAKMPHAFIGETVGTTVGGCHHITSKYLPRNLPQDSVAIVGVSAPGKAAKALCTLTDVYLPDLEQYLEPETQSKCWKVSVDFKPSRLMVWRGKTAYFQNEGKYFTFHALAAYAQYIQVPSKAVVYADPCLGPIEVNRKTIGDSNWGADLAITPYDYGAPVVLTCTDADDMPARFKLIGMAGFGVEDPVCTATRTDYAHLYQYLPGDWKDHNQRAEALLIRKTYHSRVSSLICNFPPGAVIKPVLGSTENLDLTRAQVYSWLTVH
ncbi:ORF1ab polyprotein [Rat arterivirus 1]|uniref:Replicase polyprotein 1ab n=1 Tax=RtMruf arterivirus TaxID=2847275 RepID=A0A0U2M952_9NIDO|nr:ORF1ab polyprotein [Rat arterivirus 1]ALI16778.1 ORF1ab polyprotein [Rat arterivirus 1]